MPDDDVVKPAFIARVKRELISRNWSASVIAQDAKLSNATVSNLLKYGTGTDRTVRLIANLLSITVDGDDAVALSVYGYDSKHKYEHYEGHYLWIRPIFDNEKFIGCYPLSIEWNKLLSKFEIKRIIKDGRLDGGSIYINDRGYLNIFSAQGGYASLTTVSSLTESGLMFGAMLCLGEVAGNMVAPTCAPVVLIRKPSIEGQVERLVGPGDSEYGQFRELLSRAVTGKYALFKTHLTEPA